MVIDIYADVVCPWCYIGERRLEQALAQRPNLVVERRWRPFQLNPDLPATGVPWADFARRKFGGEQRAQLMYAQVAAAGAPDGIDFAFERIVSAANTVDAHRLILLARAHGREWELAEALFAAYFSSGADLNDHAQLTAIAAGVGLDQAAVRAHLAGSAGAADVAASQDEAAQLGIRGVPFYVIDGRYAISGAQPVGVFVQALDRIAAEQTITLRE
jgi:predicted DsbA family dithiol-disulfide isomerase